MTPPHPALGLCLALESAQPHRVVGDSDSRRIIEEGLAGLRAAPPLRCQVATRLLRRIVAYRLVRDSPAVFLPDGIDDDRGVSMQATLRAMKVFTSSLNFPFAISP